MAEEEKQMSLDAVLDETPPAEAPPAEAPKEKYTTTRKEWRDKEQEAQGRVRDPETGQYAPKEPKAEVAPEPPKEAPKVETKPVVEEYSAREKAAFAKAADETRKRQALERQLAELNQKAKEPPKPFFEDPDGALARQKKELEDKINYSIMSTRIQTSESIARSRYPDYEEKLAVFNELFQNSPYIAEQAFQSPDPAEFAYKTAKTHKDLQDAGGVEKMRQKIEEETRAKVRAEIEGELKKKQEALEKDRANLPGSLTDVQSKGSNKRVWSGPPSLGEILKD